MRSHDGQKPCGWGGEADRCVSPSGRICSPARPKEPTSGSVILLGVEDGKKKITGIRDVLAEEERLASLIVDSISPKLVPSMEAVRVNENETPCVKV